MRHVDALSRAPVEEANQGEEATVADNLMVVEIGNTDFLVSLQRQDESLAKIIDTLGRESNCDEDRQMQQYYTVENHRLFREVDGLKCWVSPTRVGWRILEAYHDEKGHFGVM